MSDNDQTLIVEFEGPEEVIQKLLEKLEKMAEEEENIELVGVTVRKNK